MSDPHRPEGLEWSRQGTGSTEPLTAADPRYADPAYAGQLSTYPTGYPPYAPNPATLPQQQWAPGQPGPGLPSSGGQAGAGQSESPEPPRSPRWLWFAAGAAVLLAVGMVLGFVVANGSAKKSATISPLPAMPSTTAPARIPTTTRLAPPTISSAPPASPAPTATAPSSTPPATTPPTSSPPTSSRAAQDIVYSVTGDGRAISIAYIDAGGVLQTEFNVVLPWRKEVSLTPPASTAASVTVVNIGQQITCSVTVDGAQVRQRTGTILTICAAAG